MNETTTVLVTDDERAIRDGCHRVLTSSGYKVLGAENGQAALDLLSQHPVDILLLDLKMPVMGGEEVLEIVRRDYPHIPVIIITGHGTVDTAVGCMKKGPMTSSPSPFKSIPFS
jgi:DNA-binding NtrC family response regulator